MDVDCCCGVLLLVWIADRNVGGVSELDAPLDQLFDDRLV
jgi:hypothetical protein